MEGFFHKGRVVYAVQYELEIPPPRTAFIIVWLNPDGTSSSGTSHADPSKVIVQAKPGDKIILPNGERRIVKAVRVWSEQKRP
jgi:hypothetical protein